MFDDMAAEQNGIGNPNPASSLMVAAEAGR
jgi:hypothetical protein